MSKLRPVNVSFQLDSNKIIAFPLLHSSKKRAVRSVENGQYRYAVQSAENEQYGYAADIAFLTLYAKEILAIKIPTITYYELDKYTDWIQDISSLKSSVLVWNDTVLPSIIALPKKMNSSFNDMQYEFCEANDKVEDIITALKRSKKCEYYIEEFNEHLDSLKKNTEKAQRKLNNFFNMLINHQTELKEECQKLTNLSKQAFRFTEEQEKKN